MYVDAAAYTVTLTTGRWRRTYRQGMAVASAPARFALAVDAVIAAGAGAFALLIAQPAAAGQVPPRQPLDLTAYLLIAAAATVLVLRRVLPVATFAVTVMGLAAYFAAGYPYGPAVLTMSVAMYSVAELRAIRRSMLICVLGLGAMVAGQLVGLTPAALTDLAAVAGGSVSWLVPAWAVGAVVCAQRAAVELQRTEAARQQVYEERLRIAREVHDVVGHDLAVIALQAGVALHVFDRQPERGREALEAIRRTSRAGLDGLRGTLEPLPGDAGEPAPRRPTPGLAELEALVTATADSGVGVDLLMTGDRRELPAAIEHAAYRIVQESLTNVLRHAAPATATVRIAYGSDELAVEVTDTGRRRDGSVSGTGGTGRGITGMRARAVAVGGALDAGPRPDGGFLVLARFPLRHSIP